MFGVVNEAKPKMDAKKRNPPKNILRPSDELMCGASKSRAVSAATPSSLKTKQKQAIRTTLHHANSYIAEVSSRAR